jgi:hypothetical protein
MPATHAVDAVGLVLPTSLCAGQVGAVRTPTMRACDAPLAACNAHLDATRPILFYPIRAQIAAKVAQELNALKNASADGSTTFDAVSRSVPHLHSAPGLRSPLAAHICAGTGPAPATSAPGLRSPASFLHKPGPALQSAGLARCSAAACVL